MSLAAMAAGMALKKACCWAVVNWPPEGQTSVWMPVSLMWRGVSPEPWGARTLFMKGAKSWVGVWAGGWLYFLYGTQPMLSSLEWAGRNWASREGSREPVSQIEDCTWVELAWMRSAKWLAAATYWAGVWPGATPVLSYWPSGSQSRESRTVTPRVSRDLMRVRIVVS